MSVTADHTHASDAQTFDSVAPATGEVGDDCQSRPLTNRDEANRSPAKLVDSPRAERCLVHSNRLSRFCKLLECSLDLGEWKTRRHSRDLDRLRLHHGFGTRPTHSCAAAPRIRPGFGPP